MMIEELDRLLKKVAMLSPERQRDIAAIIASELKWDSQFSQSETELSKLANEASQEYESGKTSDESW